MCSTPFRTALRLVVGTVLALIFSLTGLAQSHSAFPVDIVAGPAPQPVKADGRTWVLYELHLINFSKNPIELLGLDVLGKGVTPLASYRGEELEKLLVAVGPADGAGKVRVIGGGRSVVIFLNVTLNGGTHLPAELRHRFLFSIKKDGSGADIEDTVNGPRVTVVQDPAPVLRPPLKGSAWIAFNGLADQNHRRAMVPIDGKLRIAQRFAIDWMRLGPDGRLFHGDPKSNASFYGYGAEVLAVADAQVSELKDGLPENAGSNEQSSRKITLDNVVGNYLILDLGHGRFALYAHLQPGSLEVKLGERVKAGQVLARLGNSGNSDAPHLHFHLVDGNSPVGAEGIPYELDTFTQLGLAGDPAALISGRNWQHKSEEKPVVRQSEFPVDGAVVTFP